MDIVIKSKLSISKTTNLLELSSCRFILNNLDIIQSMQLCGLKCVEGRLNRQIV